VNLPIGEGTVRLTLLSTGHERLFLPFRDATSGSETYGAGRYLDLEAPGNGTVTIDFNLAYNPFCAYRSSYSCALAPTENWLTVPIEAGELAYVSPMTVLNSEPKDRPDFANRTPRRPRIQGD
jgi:uncharacterized protein (DUF1684 family)